MGLAPPISLCSRAIPLMGDGPVLTHRMRTLAFATGRLRLEHLHNTFLKDAESIDLCSILLCRDTLVILVSHLSTLQLRTLKPF